MPPEKKYDLKKIIIVGVLLLVIMGLLGYWFFVIRKPAFNDPSQTKNLFPFGDNQTTTSLTDQGNTPGIVTPPLGENPIKVTEGDRLRMVANYPVTGYYSFIENRLTPQPKFDEKTKETIVSTLNVPVNILRFNVKEKGFLIDAEINTDSIIVSQKTKTEFPVPEELWFTRAGSGFVFRTWNDYENTIDSFVASLPEIKPLGYCEKTLTGIVAQGSKNETVKELQKYLAKKLAVVITADGSFGAKTTTLVKQLQNLFALPQTGKLDDLTREAINGDCLNIQTDYANKNKGPFVLTGAFLPSNILRGTSSPDGTSLFFLKKNNSGSVIGTLASANGTNQKPFFESPFSEWNPVWINENLITMTTLASREANGYLYGLNPKTGDFKKILGPIRGLTTNTNPDGTKVLYTTSTDKGIITRVYTIANGNLQTLEMPTLAEKCVWKDNVIIICAIPQTTPSAQYPDAWYQGLLSFSDSIWSINTDSGVTNLILAPLKAFDMIKPGLSPDKNYFFFINKKDSTLWSYRLND